MVISDSKEVVIETVSLKKRFNKITVLKDVTIKCKKGQIIGIIGRNGSGKSVFFKCLCGLMKATGGEIYKWKPLQDTGKY